jgi:hypothetical protein
MSTVVLGLALITGVSEFPCGSTPGLGLAPVVLAITSGSAATPAIGPLSTTGRAAGNGSSCLLSGDVLISEVVLVSPETLESTDVLGSASGLEIGDPEAAIVEFSELISGAGSPDRLLVAAVLTTGAFVSLVPVLPVSSIPKRP